MKHIEIVILVFVMAIGGLSHLYAQTWEQLSYDSTYQITKVKIDTTSNRIFVLAYTGSGGERQIYLLNTPVETLSWKVEKFPYNGDISGINCNDMYVDSLSHVFVATENGVYYTTDAGASWSHPTYGLQEAFVQAITVDGDFGVLAGTMWGGMFRLSEWGDYWEPFHEDILGNEVIYDVYANNNMLAVSASQKVFLSVDAGATWKTYSHPERVPYGFVYIPELMTLYYNITDSIVVCNIETMQQSKYFVGLNAYLYDSKMVGDILYIDASLSMSDYEVVAFNTKTKVVGYLDTKEIDSQMGFIFAIAVDNENAIYVASRKKIFRTHDPVVVSTSPLEQPESSVLSSSYPNPAKAGTIVTVTYTLDRQANATLVVHDMLGRRVREVLLGDAVSGVHTARIRTQNMPAGLYYFTLQSSAHATPLTGKMLLTQ